VVTLVVRFLALGAFLAVTPLAAPAAEGVRGRASLEGVLVEGVEVRVYPYRPGTFGPLTGVSVLARARTTTDGSYEIPLPPGRYVVEGLKKADGAAATAKGPETGDLQCLYSGSPITVSPGAWTAVGLNLVKVPAEERKKTADGASALRGRLTLKGQDVGKAYLYAYDEVGTVFHGPARVLQPVAKGSFRLRAPPGTYYLVARKRARGGAYGPIETGDLFNFYPRNPVVLGPGEEVTVELPLVERLSQLEEDAGAFQGLTVRLLEPGGKAAAGYYVLAYPTAQRSGPPLSTSPRTDAEGRTRLPLAPGQTAHLRARKSLGGPLERGELFADGPASTAGGAELTLKLKKAP
jgi:hypothetical protein